MKLLTVTTHGCPMASLSSLLTSMWFYRDCFLSVCPIFRIFCLQQRRNDYSRTTGNVSKVNSKDKIPRNLDIAKILPLHTGFWKMFFYVDRIQTFSINVDRTFYCSSLNVDCFLRASGDG